MRAAALLMLLGVAGAAAAQPPGSLAADRAFARWVLEAAPPDAVLLADGPADAVALRALQDAGLRPDVAVVPVPDLAAPEAARALAARHGLPLPDSVETFETRLGARGSTDTPDGRFYTLADRVVDHWLAPGVLDRPLVGTVTLHPAVLGTKTEVVDRGAVLIPASERGFDAEAAWAGLRGLRGEDFAAPALEAGRLDPAGLVLFQVLQTAVTFAQAGDAEAAEQVHAASVTFAEASGRPGDPLVETARFWIDDALAERDS